MRLNTPLSWIAEDLRPLAVPVETIEPDPRNARTHSPKNLAAIAESLRRFGQRRPIVVNRRNQQVEAGHGLLEAAKTLGWTHVAAVWVDDDPAAQTGFAVADNRTAELAEWDDVLLASLLSDLSSDDGLADYQAFSDALLLADLADLTKNHHGDTESTEGPEPKLDQAAALEKKWKTKPGQLWEIPGKAGVHRLLCGDANDPEKMATLIPPLHATAIVTDPPYAIANQFGEQSTSQRGKRSLQFSWDQVEGVAETVAGVLGVATSHAKENAALFVFTSIDLIGRLLPVCRAAGFTVKPAALVKTCPPAAGKGNWWPSGFELAFYGYRTGAYFADADPKRSNVFYADGYRHGQPGKVDHPTQKPLGLITRIVEALSPPGETILDPFLGSGTTMVAAEQLGRVCYGIEIEPKYVAVALERMADMALTPALAGG